MNPSADALPTDSDAQRALRLADRKAVAAALKEIYRAVGAGVPALAAFEECACGRMPQKRRGTDEPPAPA